jgi:hypothetical protein
MVSHRRPRTFGTTTRMRIVGVIGLFCCLSIPARAQDAQVDPADTSAVVSSEQVLQKPTGPPPTPAHTSVKAMLKGLVTDFENLPSKENALWAGIGGAAALAVHPADDSVNADLVGKNYVHKIFAPGRIIGATPTLFGIAVTIYAVGRSKDEPEGLPRWHGPVGGELPVVRRRRLNERVTAVVIPAQIRIVARRQSGTKTRPRFNRSSSRGVRALDSSQRRARVMPQSVCDTAHDSGPRQRYPLTLARALSSPMRGSGVIPSSPAWVR